MNTDILKNEVAMWAASIQPHLNAVAENIIHAGRGPIQANPQQYDRTRAP